LLRITSNSEISTLCIFGIGSKHSGKGAKWSKSPNKLGKIALRFAMWHAYTQSVASTSNLTLCLYVWIFRWKHFL